MVPTYRARSSNHTFFLPAFLLLHHVWLFLDSDPEIRRHLVHLIRYRLFSSLTQHCSQLIVPPIHKVSQILLNFLTLEQYQFLYGHHALFIQLISDRQKLTCHYLLYIELSRVQIWLGRHLGAEIIFWLCISCDLDVDWHWTLLARWALFFLVCHRHVWLRKAAILDRRWFCQFWSCLWLDFDLLSFL